MTVKERLKAILKEKGISQYSFCKKIGVSKGYINSIRNSISPSVLSRIDKEFSGEIDTFYLVTGKDVRSKETTITNDSLFKRIADEEKKNTELKKEISRLKIILKEREETIEQLNLQIEKLQQ